MFKITAPFQPTGDQPRAIKKLIAGVKAGERYLTLLGVTGSGKTFTIANVIKEFNMPVLVMAPNKALAAQLYREYKTFFPQNSVNYFVSYYDYYQPEAYLPITDTYIEKEAKINQEIDRLRHQATSALMTRRDVIVVASVSCIYNLGIPSQYFESAIKLEMGQPIVSASSSKSRDGRADLIRELVKIQFTRTNSDLQRGSFRVRGDLFEILPASDKEVVYRISLADQKVASIEETHWVTRKSLRQLDHVIIFPSKHFVSNEPQIRQAVADVKAELAERLKYFKKQKLYIEAERLKRRTRFDMEMLKTIGYCHGIENYSRHLSGKLSGEAPETLFSYFPYKDGCADFLTVIDESHISVPQIRGMYAGDRSRKETLVKYGWRLPSALDNRPLKFTEFQERVNTMLFVSATPGEWELQHSQTVAEQVIRPTGLIDPPIEVRPVYDAATNRSQVDDVMSELNKIVVQDERAIINVLTKRMAEDLAQYLERAGFKVKYLHSGIRTLQRTEILTDFRRGKFNVLVGVNLLREGLDLPEVTLVAIFDVDREGFLRSDTSLIQTMGRTARNVKGKVILYADKITGSMQRAISEVERRRQKQQAYNKKHGITPQSIQKEITEFLDIPKDENFDKDL